jgi:hypothetical protein
MRKLTTLAIGTFAAAYVTTVAVAAPPALADDGQGGAFAPSTPAIADVLRTFGTVAAVLAGIVLLAKITGAYRRSQWRRQWIIRHSAETMFVSSVGWPAGGISGRSVARNTAPF